MKAPRILTAGIAALVILPAASHAADRNWVGLPGTSNWNDTTNWSGGAVPTTGTNDNLFIHTTASITGVAIDAANLYLGSGTALDPTSGFTFGTGVSNIGNVYIGENHNGTNLNNGYARAFIHAGTTLNVAGSFFVGDWDGNSGDVVQDGGDVTVSGQVRVGHWPQAGGTGATSSYTLSAGTFTVTGDPNNPFDEGQNGNVFLGIDSTGILKINGGTFTAKGIAFDNRGATPGQDTLQLDSGALNLGANGLSSQNAGDPTTYLVNLGGGTIRSTASWNSNLQINLTTSGSGVHFDSNGNNNTTLSGVVTGAGPLRKDGVGILSLTNQNTYTGATTVTGGTLSVTTGFLYSNFGFGNVQITLKGGGTIETGGWADGDTAGLGQVSFAAGNIIVDNGTLRYTASSSTGNSDRSFTIGAGGATLEALSPNNTTWNVADVGRGFQIASTSGGSLTLKGSTPGVLGQIFPGTGGLTKTGNGIWTLTGANTYSGGTTVSGGTLVVGNASALGATTGNLTVNAGTLDLNGNSVTVGTFGGTGGNITTSIPGAVTLVTSFSASTSTFSGTITDGGGSVGLTKSGNGTLVLTGAHTYSGPTSVIGGTIQIGAGGIFGSLGTGTIAVSAGGALAYNRTDATTLPNALSGTGALAVNSGTLRLSNVSGSLAASVAAGATLGSNGALGAVIATAGSFLEAGIGNAGNFTSASLALTNTTLRTSLGAANPEFVVTAPNGLVANGTNTIQVNPAGLVLGTTYTLIDYAGTLGGAGFGAFTLIGVPARAVGGLINNTANTSIDLKITSFDFPKWTGTVSGDWDGATQNWKLVTAGTATTYLDKDAVLFDDTATGVTTVNLTSVLTPTSVTFNNSAKTYTLTGTGALSGTTGLTKQNNGRVIVANTGTNNYAGLTDVQGGTLQIGDGTNGALGPATSVNIATAAAVELNLANAATYSTPTTGTGTLRTIGGNSFNLATGILTNAPTLNIAGTDSQVIGANDQIVYNGNITITGGTLKALSVQALGTTAGSTTISGSGTLDVNNLDLGAEQVFIAGNGVGGNGAVVNTAGGNIFGLHKLTLTANASIGGLNRWDVRTTGLAGELVDLAGFKLTKVGNNQISIVDVSVTSGDIDINGGIFGIENVAAVQGLGTITINPAGTLGLWVNQPGKLTRSIVAKGGAISELGSGGITTVDAPITLQSNLSYTVNGGATVLNQNGIISESGGSYTLNKEGPGRLILLADNTFTGGFNADAGILQVGNGATNGSLGSGPSTVNATLIFAKSFPTTVNGDINPAGAAGTIDFINGGEVTLASGTDIKANTIEFGIGAANSTVGGTLDVGPSASVEVTGALRIGNSDGAGPLTQGVLNQAGGIVNIDTPNTDGRNFVLGHWGNTQGIYNLSAGTLNSAGISMAISWDGAGTFNLSGGTANVLGLRFGHNAGQTGVFNLTGGQLNLGSEGIWTEVAGRPSDINLGGGTLRAVANTNIVLPIELTGSNGDVTIDTNGNSLTVTGAITGTGGFTKTGNGRLVLNATNTASGIFTVSAGTLSVMGDQAQDRIPNNGIVQIGSGATFEFGSTNAASFSANYIVSAGGTITNAAGVAHDHLGSVQLNGGTWTTDPAAASYDGENFFLNGNVTVAGFSPSLITQQGGDTTNRGIGWIGSVTFDVSLTGASAPDLVVSTELENSDSGSAALVKVGAGAMNLTFANTYTGGTTVSGGTLLVNNTTGSGTGSGNLTIAAGAILGGKGTVGSGGSITASLSGKLSPGNLSGDSVGTLSFNLGNGTLDLTGAVGAPASASLLFDLGTTSDRVNLTSGSLTIGAGVLEFNDFLFTPVAGFTTGDYVLFDTTTNLNGTLGANLSGTISAGFFGTLQTADNGHDLILHVIPEPGSAVLLLGGLSLLATRRRRKGARS